MSLSLLLLLLSEDGDDEDEVGDDDDRVLLTWKGGRIWEGDGRERKLGRPVHDNRRRRPTKDDDDDVDDRRPAMGVRADEGPDGDENENVAVAAFVQLAATAGSDGTKARVMLEPAHPSTTATGPVKEQATVAEARVLVELGVIVATATATSVQGRCRGSVTGDELGNT